MHVAIVSCTRKHAFELGPNLLSLSRHCSGCHVHVFTDTPGREALSSCVEHFQKSLARLELHSIDDLGAPMVDYDASLGPSPRLQSSKFACASAKLMLQGAPAFANVPYLLALDVDTVTNEDLSELWPWTTRMEQASALWGLVRESGEEAPLTFGNELKDVRPPELQVREYYNTGVLLIAASRLRERNLTHPSQLLAELPGETRKYDEFGLGEQNLLNAWVNSEQQNQASRRRKLVLSLPCRWNRRIDRGCYDTAGGIRHANRMLATPRDWEMVDTRLRRLLRDLEASEAAWKRADTTPEARHARRPESACGPEELRPEMRSNASAVKECVYLVTKRWAREDVRPWHEQYHGLECAKGKANRLANYNNGRRPS